MLGNVYRNFGLLFKNRHAFCELVIQVLIEGYYEPANKVQLPFVYYIFHFITCSGKDVKQKLEIIFLLPLTIGYLGIFKKWNLQADIVMNELFSVLF